jgi:hypothetical protein
MTNPVAIRDATDASVNVAADDVAGYGRVQVVKLLLGGDGVDGGQVASGNPVPVSGTVGLDSASLSALESISVANFPATQPVSGEVALDSATLAALETINANTGGLTDAQLRATPVPMVGTVNSPPAADAPGAVVRQAPVDIFVTSFAAVGSGLLATEMTQRRLGTGVAVSQSAGNLVVTTGTTTNAEFLARSVRSFNGAMLARAQTILSQRIVNQNFAFILADRIGEGLAYTINSATSINVTLSAHGFTAANVGQGMFVGAITGAAGVPGRWVIASIPDVNTIAFTVAGWPASGSGTLDLFGWNHYRIQYSGVTATAAAFDAQRRGWASGDSTLTINTTASPGHIVNVGNDGRNAYVADMLAATSATPTITTRGSRYANMPDSDVELFAYLWSWNGTVAPASTTTWTVGFISVEDTTNNVVYLGGLRPMGQAAPMPVAPQGTTTVAGTVTATVTGYPTAAASADALANPTVTKIDATSLLFNGTTWDRARGNVNAVVETSAARTATGTGTTQTNFNARGALIWVNVTAVTGTTPTMTVRVQWSPDGGTTWLDLDTTNAQTASITATGASVLRVYPGIATTANASLNMVLPRTWRLAWTIGGTTPSFTFAAQASYIL